jgi:hypothetical protein
MQRNAVLDTEFSKKKGKNGYYLIATNEHYE